MTRQEFNRKSEKVDKIVGLCLLFFMVTLLGLTFLCQYLFAYITRHFHTNRWETPGSVLLLILLFGGLFGTTFMEWRLARKWGMACPKCGRRFIDKVRRRVSLMGKCPKCSAEIFEDEPIGTQRCSHNLDREEFKMKLENFTRRLNRKLIRLMIIAVALMFGIVPLSKYLQRLVENGDLDWIPLTQWRWFAVIMLGFVFLSFFSVFFFAAMGKFRPRDLPCPGCNRPLLGSAGKMAIETGMCVYCGCGLFKEPSEIRLSTTRQFRNNPPFWN